MAHGKRLTIRDVAAAAGVSIQTVSRVLNNRPDVAPETLQRVQEVIRRTGYAPNMLARSLTQGRSHTLGVVAYGLEYFGPSRVLTAIERKAAEMGYGITLNLILEPETDAVDHVLDALRARQVDGIIWAIPDVGDNRAWSRTKGSELPVPIMLVGGMAGRPYLPSIGIDNAAIGCLATEHLLAGGARKVGIITGPLSWWEAQQRLRGWRKTLEDHGLEAPDQPDRRGRLDGHQRRTGSVPPSRAVPRDRRGLCQQRPDGPRRPPRGPSRWAARARRAVCGGRRQHGRGISLLAAADDGPPAAR